MPETHQKKRLRLIQWRCICCRARAPSSLDETHAYSYAVNTWYCFEVNYNQSAAGGYGVWLNGNPILSRTGVDTSSRAFGRFEVGDQWSNYKVTTIIDCVVIARLCVFPSQPSADILAPDQGYYRSAVGFWKSFRPMRAYIQQSWNRTNLHRNLQEGL